MLPYRYSFPQNQWLPLGPGVAGGSIDDALLVNDTDLYIIGGFQEAPDNSVTDLNSAAKCSVKTGETRNMQARKSFVFDGMF